MDVLSLSTTSPEDARIMRLIQSEFPGWRAWRSDTGRWWAFRTAVNPLTIKQLRAGCRLTVPADSGAALRAAVRAEIAAAEHTGTG